MPSFIKNKKDEHLWKQAKQQYEKALERDKKAAPKDKWAYVADIFWRMKKHLGGPEKTPHRKPEKSKSKAKGTTESHLELAQELIATARSLLDEQDHSDE